MNDCLSLFQAVQLTFPYHLQDPVLFCLLQVNALFQTVHVGGGSNETTLFFLQVCICGWAWLINQECWAWHSWKLGRIVPLITMFYSDWPQHSWNVKNYIYLIKKSIQITISTLSHLPSTSFIFTLLMHTWVVTPMQTNLPIKNLDT